MNRDYELIRSRRRTISVEITKDLLVLVRAPKWMPLYEIDRFVEKNRNWIDKHLAKAANKRAQREKIDPINKDDLERLKLEAKYIIPGRVRYYADLLGVSYGRITVRIQKTLWGSCSAKGNLSFNCLLMDVPEHIRDYVIVHELCHRLHMNHSPAFWDSVSKIIPDYKACRKWLRTEGALYMEALEKGQE